MSGDVMSSFYSLVPESYFTPSALDQKTAFT